MKPGGRLRWWVADRVNRLRAQCWSDLVDWALHDRKDDPGQGLRAGIPWRPIGESCRKDAQSAGRCYCGKVGSDGTVLRYGEYVCPTPMPGQATRRVCSRPGGHDGMHRCGGIEWGTA